MTDYTYPLTDFSNGLNEGRFSQEINNSAIASALQAIGTNAGNAVISFWSALSSGDATLLTALVAAHSGLPLPTAINTVHVDALADEDNKLVVVTYPGTVGFKTYFTGAGDNLSTGERGTGQAIKMAFTGAGIQSIDVQFSAPAEVHDGEIVWSPVSNWGFDDTFSVSAVLPATTATANNGNTGNANKVATGLGFNLIVPAAGNGAWDVNLGTAVPVPSDVINVDTGAQTHQGYWDTNYYTGVITPGVNPGSSGFNLLDVSPPEMYLLKNIMMGNPLGVFDIDVYKVEWFHQNWLFRFSVNKVSSGAGTIGGWIFTFRT
jgi:hypothetical protein